MHLVPNGSLRIDLRRPPLLLMASALRDLNFSPDWQNLGTFYAILFYYKRIPGLHQTFLELEFRCLIQLFSRNKIPRSGEWWIPINFFDWKDHFHRKPMRLGYVRILPNCFAVINLMWLLSIVNYTIESVGVISETAIMLCIGF